MTDIPRTSCPTCGATFIALSRRDCSGCISETIALADIGRRFDREDRAA